VVYGATLVICAAALLGSGRWLLGDAVNSSDMTLPIGLPWLGAHFRLDALASFFLVVVNLGGAAASLYGLGYGHHDPTPHRVLPFFPAFLAGMNLVVLADDAFSYLLCWEFMSLASWALVMAHHRETGNAKAGYIYLVMASFGTLCLLFAFGVLAGPAGQYSFAAMRMSSPDPALALIAFAAALVGTGSKAGLVPLHVWLPEAHPAAPSPVSAMMSGVMLKTAIYGKASQEQDAVAASAEQLGEGWVKLTPKEPLAPGEYAVAEMLGKQGMNSYVWDFGVHPNAPANLAVIKPEVSHQNQPTGSAQELQRRP
jgi:formate hydrogenlyase subunit 3/multisubunit Na+/H+ antiporter MnhD subunit